MTHRNTLLERMILLLHHLHPQEFKDRFGAEFRADLRLAMQSEGAVTSAYRIGALGLIWDTMKTLVGSWTSRVRRVRGTPRGPSPLRNLRSDVRMAMRGVTRHPMAAVVTILTLAVGIGANSAVFSVFHGIVIDEPPYADPDGIAVIPSYGTLIGAVDWYVVDAVAGAPGVEDTGYFIGGGNANFLEGEGEGRVRLAQVSHNFFDVLGVDALVGSTLSTAPDDRKIAVIGYGLWTRAFGSDPGVVGRDIILSGIRYRITGVAPPRVEFPDRTEVWVPGPTNFDFYGSAVGAAAIVRLEETADFDASGREIVLRSEAEAEREGFEFDLERAPVLVPLREEISGQIQAPLLVLITATVLILLLACANLASISLARLTARRPELRARVALGASRGRIARQLLTETTFIALLSGVVALALAAGGVPILISLLPAETPGLESIQFGLPALLLTGSLTLAAGLLVGFAPAFEGARMATSGRLSAMRSDDLRVRRVREMLTVAQVGVAAVLMIGSSLLAKSLLELREIDQGYDLEGVVTFQVQLPSEYYDRGEGASTYMRDALERLSALRGVTGAGAATNLPLTAGMFRGLRAWAEGAAETQPGFATLQEISADYFRSMGIDVLEGTSFSENPSDELTVVINRAYADSLFGGGPAAGRRMMLNLYPDTVPARVLGVVEDVRVSGVQSSGGNTIYRPLEKHPSRSMGFAVRVVGPMAERVTEIRSVMAEIDNRVPPFAMATTGDRVAAHLAERRAMSIVVGVIAGLAGFLVAIGLYGILSHGVLQRRREIGIRMALGAHGAWIVRSILVRAGVLTGVGVAAGLGVAAMTVSKLEDLLYQVELTDPQVLLGSPILIVVLAALAAWIPARTATRIDPASAFRID